MERVGTASWVKTPKRKFRPMAKTWGRSGALPEQDTSELEMKPPAAGKKLFPEVSLGRLKAEQNPCSTRPWGSPQTFLLATARRAAQCCQAAEAATRQEEQSMAPTRWVLRVLEPPIAVLPLLLLPCHQASAPTSYPRSGDEVREALVIKPAPHTLQNFLPSRASICTYISY